MELFKEARVKIGQSILSKKITRMKRKVFYSNSSLIKTIGIVWDSSRTEDFSSLSRFYQKMHNRSIDVKVIGYYPGKELPDQYTALRYLSCIRKKEINMFFIPVSTETDVFINTQFDILIDINFAKLLPLRYITSLSKASFKVGLFESESGSSVFDLMMEMKTPVQVENYLNEVIHYLDMINSPTAINIEK